MFSSGTPSLESVCATDENDEPLRPGPSSAMAKTLAFRLAAISSSSGVSAAFLLNGWPLGRRVNDRTVEPSDSSSAAITEERLAPMLRGPMQTTSGGLLSSKNFLAEARKTSGQRP